MVYHQILYIVKNTWNDYVCFPLQLPLSIPVPDCSCMLSYGHYQGSHNFSSQSQYLQSTGSIKTVQAYFSDTLLVG